MQFSSRWKCTQGERAQGERARERVNRTKIITNWMLFRLVSGVFAFYEWKSIKSTASRKMLLWEIEQNEKSEKNIRPDAKKQRALGLLFFVQISRVALKPAQSVSYKKSKAYYLGNVAFFFLFSLPSSPFFFRSLFGSFWISVCCRYDANQPNKINIHIHWIETVLFIIFIVSISWTLTDDWNSNV